ncbi:MAG: OmpA family protein [Endomicrobiales bacterium]|nr:OmpA family protein [Endomicrobiales bacterium]
MSSDLVNHEQDSAIERIWTIVYSDMITNLMLFFLMLYALSRMGGDARQEIMQGMEEKFRGKSAVEFRAQKVLKDVKEEEAAQRVSSLMEKQGVSKYTQVEINEKQIKITLNIPVLFASGNADLADSAKSALSGVSNILRSVSNKVIIEGHTDNLPVSQGLYASNWELSVARAYSVIEYFVQERRLDPSRFIAAGYGEYRPVAPNNTPEGRAANRRIEIVMVRKR